MSWIEDELSKGVWNQVFTKSQVPWELAGWADDSSLLHPAELATPL